MSSNSFYDRLRESTATERESFLRVPLIKAAISGCIDRPLYLAYLEQAYHHVKHTCPLLAASLARCGPHDTRLQTALFEYIEEERGHDDWILQDIADLGGDAGAVHSGESDDPVRVMVGYAYYAIERLSPYSMLGMVHVLEGMSVELAHRAATGIAGAIGGDETKGFSYLKSHGCLDLEHVRFFEELVDEIATPENASHIVDTARIMYRLFGDMFQRIGERHGVCIGHAA